MFLDADSTENHSGHQKIQSTFLNNLSNKITGLDNSDDVVLMVQGGNETPASTARVVMTCCEVVVVMILLLVGAGNDTPHWGIRGNDSPRRWHW
jgi:hypothetical protein